MLPTSCCVEYSGAVREVAFTKGEPNEITVAVKPDAFAIFPSWYQHDHSLIDRCISRCRIGIDQVCRPNVLTLVANYAFS